jgi:hypothetical protein
MAGIFFRPKDGATRLDISARGSSPTDRFSGPHAAYRLAMAGYVPGRYRGPITIFRSETYFGRPDLGWGTVASRIDVQHIPSDYSTMFTRHVQIVGERLRACLQHIYAGESAGTCE